jgi:hypothetical protein
LFGETVGDVTFMNNDVNAAVCNFFGVPNVRLFARTKKKNKDNLGVYLPNIDEIREVFKGTEFEWMID